MTFEKAADFIEYISHRTKTTHPDSDLITLMEELDHPERKLKCFHVAGTNGKGSTTDYLRSILQHHGYKVGSFTSPHLVVHNDRIRINNINISDDRLLELGNRFRWAIDKYDLSMFRIDTLISIYYFLEEKVDYAIYEVGMGGRLDSTNIIYPMVSVITNIGFDHMAYLGNTLDKIAYEKAGIIKEGIPVFTGEPKKICLDVFDAVARERNTSVTRIRAPKGDIENRKVHFCYYGYDISLPTLALYQVKNASLALRVADYCRINGLIDLTRDDIKSGLENTFWDGRFEIIREKPLTILDGAHNEHGITAIKESVRKLPRPICIIASILSDKQYDKMIKTLQHLCDELIITSFINYRATNAETLAGQNDVTVIDDYREALKYAEEKYADGTILITGSLYFVSEIRALYKGE